jgi:hypothetical protein
MILGNDTQTSVTVRRIRKLFLEPKESYSVREAARALGIAAKEPREWIDAGEVEVSEAERNLTVPWSEVVTFGIDIWSQAAVEEALGENVAVAIPELLRLTELSVRLPRMEVFALEKVAAHEGRTVDALLASQLLDFVSAEADRLAEQIPGFAAALAWPAAASDGVTA